MEVEFHRIRKEEQEDELLQRFWWKQQSGQVDTESDGMSEGHTLCDGSSSDEYGDDELKLQRSVLKACGKAEEACWQKEGEEEQIVRNLIRDEEREIEQAQATAYEFERAVEKKRVEIAACSGPEQVGSY